MNAHKKLLTVLSMLIVISLIGIGAFALLRRETPPANQTTAPSESDPSTDTIPLSVANTQARALEREANESVEHSPEAAQQKYTEAEKKYKEAGNDLKAFEMRNNAETVMQSAPTDTTPHPAEETPLSTGNEP